MKELFQWFVYSSKDPKKFSLTVKAGATTIVSIIAAVLALLGLEGLPQTDLVELLTKIVETLGDIVVNISMLVTLYGAVRKLFVTILDHRQ